MTTTMGNAGRISKKQIHATLAPLSDALLKRGEMRPRIEAFGFIIEGLRLYNAPGCTGPAWNPNYRIVGASNSGAGGIPGGGTRFEFEEQLYRYLNRYLPRAAIARATGE